MRAKEEALVDAFVVPGKRVRYKSLLANRKRRAKILDRLDHTCDLDSRFATEIPSKTDVVALLRSQGAPDVCHVMSVVARLDGREMPLQEAIEEIESYMSGTLVGCIPGRLAYYYGEAGEQRLLLVSALERPVLADSASRGR